MGNEIAIAGQPAVPAFGLNEVEKIATAIARGGLFGSKDPYAVLTLCMLAQAEGQHPAVVFRDYDLIQGKPSKKSEAMLRDFLAGGGKVTWNRLDDECAEAVFSHPQGGTVTINWTLARASKAGLGGKDMWKKYPRQMLRSRVISEGVRTVYPNATSGLYVPEEVRDFGGETAPVDTPPTPEPKRARDLKSESMARNETALIVTVDAKRIKAEEWLSWLKGEVESAGGEVEAVSAIFEEAAANLSKMEKQFPDIYAEAMTLKPSVEAAAAPTASQDDGTNDAHPGAAIADALIAEVNDMISVLDISTLMAEREADIQAMLPEDGARVEIAADKRRRAIRDAREKANAEVAE